MKYIVWAKMTFGPRYLNFAKKRWVDDQLQATRFDEFEVASETASQLANPRDVTTGKVVVGGLETGVSEVKR